MTTRLTPEQERAIEEFLKTRQHIAGPESVLRVAYPAHVSALLAEIDALRDEVAAAKAGLVWSDELPTEPGLYWLRSKWSITNRMTPMLVEVYRGVGGVLTVLFHGSEREGSVYDDPSNQWIGPIAPPETEP